MGWDRDGGVSISFEQQRPPPPPPLHGSLFRSRRNQIDRTQFHEAAVNMSKWPQGHALGDCANQSIPPPNPIDLTPNPATLHPNPPSPAPPRRAHARSEKKKHVRLSSVGSEKKAARLPTQFQEASGSPLPLEEPKLDAPTLIRGSFVFGRGGRGRRSKLSLSSLPVKLKAQWTSPQFVTYGVDVLMWIVVVPPPPQASR
jgi:hypothetical protein